MNKMDWSLIWGVIILVAGTFFGTCLIHLSNRKANTKRIEALEKTFTQQNDDLKDQSNQIKKVADSVFGLSQKLNNTTTSIAEVSDDISKISNSTGELVSYIKKDVDNLVIHDFNLQLRISHLGGTDLRRIYEKNITEKYTIEFWQLGSENEKLTVGLGECTHEFSDLYGNKMTVIEDETVVIDSKIDYTMQIASSFKIDKSKKLYFKTYNLSYILSNNGLGTSLFVYLKSKRNQQPFGASQVNLQRDEYHGYFVNVNF